MKSQIMKFLSRLLIVTMIVLPFQAANAGMISTNSIASTSEVNAQVNAQRSVVTAALNRSQTVSALSTYGITPMSAEARVASMTDAEVATIAGRIQAAPAGADGGLIALILVVFLIWLVVQRR
jgi:hypothetical protein